MLSIVIPVHLSSWKTSLLITCFTAKAISGRRWALFKVLLPELSLMLFTFTLRTSRTGYPRSSCMDSRVFFCSSRNHCCGASSSWRRATTRCPATCRTRGREPSTRPTRCQPGTRHWRRTRLEHGSPRRRPPGTRCGAPCWPHVQARPRRAQPRRKTMLSMPSSSLYGKTVLSTAQYYTISARCQLTKRRPRHMSAICRYLSGMPTNDPLKTPHLSKPPTDHRQINRQMVWGLKCVKSGKYSEKYTSPSPLSSSVDLSVGGWGCTRKTPSPSHFACCTYRAREVPTQSPGRSLTEKSRNAAITIPAESQRAKQTRTFPKPCAQNAQKAAQNAPRSRRARQTARSPTPTERKPAQGGRGRILENRQRFLPRGLQKAGRGKEQGS